LKGVRIVIRKWRTVEAIDETRTLAVSGSGGGLYLYLPKPLCELYSIVAGDQIKVTLRAHIKRDYAAEEKGEGRKGPRRQDEDGEL
jgi:hypothetical protein